MSWIDGENFYVDSEISEGRRKFTLIFEFIQNTQIFIVKCCLWNCCQFKWKIFNNINWKIWKYEENPEYWNTIIERTEASSNYSWFDFFVKIKYQFFKESAT